MAKALMGFLASDLRAPDRLTVENARLRARVAELETLVVRLSEENDVLIAEAAERVADLQSDLQLA